MVTVSTRLWLLALYSIIIALVLEGTSRTTLCLAPGIRFVVELPEIGLMVVGVVEVDVMYLNPFMVTLVL
jgi:hypothetical protein